MSVAFYDFDLMKYGYVPPNLEIMKMSTYFKNRNVLVEFAREFKPENYENFYIRKDFLDGDYPKEMYSPQSILGGYAFSNGIYVPLENVEMESSKPDKNLYRKAGDLFARNERELLKFRGLLRAEHFRFSLDGKVVWRHYKRQLHQTGRERLFFAHDYNLNKIKNIDLAILDLVKDKTLNKHKKYFGNKFPIILNNPEDFLKWIKIPTMKDGFILTYNGILTDYMVERVVQEKKRTNFLGQIDFLVTKKSLNENDFFKNTLPKIFRQVTILRSFRQKILLNYETNFFSNFLAERFIDALNLYMRNGEKTLDRNVYLLKRDSFIAFSNSFDEKKAVEKSFTKEELFQVIRYIEEASPETFNLLSIPAMDLIGIEYYGGG